MSFECQFEESKITPKEAEVDDDMETSPQHEASSDMQLPVGDDKVPKDKLAGAVDSPSLCNNSTNTASVPSSLKTQLRYRKVRQRVKTLQLECEWNMCTEVETKMEKFLVHIQEHLNEITEPCDDNYLCFWHDCGMMTADQDELIRHVFFHAFHTKIKSVGTNLKRETQIEECAVDSQTRNLLPELPEAFQCLWEGCRALFYSAQHYYWHVEGHAMYVEPLGTPKSYKCGWEGCKSQFQKMIRLKEHARSHTQEKLVGCPNCGGIFSSTTKFYDHCNKQKTDKTQNYQCSYCSRKFASERLLRDHLRFHINHYKCHICDMTCPSPSNLARHIQYKHTDSKPFKCSQCSRKCNSASDLQKHMLRHSSEPAFNCSYPECTFKCRSMSTINRHVKRVHRKERYIYACHLCYHECNFGCLLSQHLVKVHNFQWPSGHSRFRYKKDVDGKMRLQTIRYESLELSQLMENKASGENGEEEGENVPSEMSDALSQFSVDSPASALSMMSSEYIVSSPAESQASHSEQIQTSGGRGKTLVELSKPACQDHTPMAESSAMCRQPLQNIQEKCVPPREAL